MLRFMTDRRRSGALRLPLGVYAYAAETDIAISTKMTTALAVAESISRWPLNYQ